jgi:hypothetical protein
MNRSTTFASLAILATLAASPVAAQAPSGSGATGYLSGAGNVVGGGTATLHGGGDEMVILYSRGGAGGGAGMAQLGRQAGFGPSLGDGLEVAYLGQAPAGHGRKAWLTGGGEETAVVYASPIRR